MQLSAITNPQMKILENIQSKIIQKLPIQKNVWTLFCTLIEAHISFLRTYSQDESEALFIQNTPISNKMRYRLFYLWEPGMADFQTFEGAIQIKKVPRIQKSNFCYRQKFLDDSHVRNTNDPFFIMKWFYTCIPIWAHGWDRISKMIGK